MACGDRATLCSGRPRPSHHRRVGWSTASQPVPCPAGEGYFHFWSIYNVCSYKQGSKNNSSVPLGCPETLRVALGLERLELFRARSEKPDYRKTISGCCDLLEPLTTVEAAAAEPWGCGWRGAVGCGAEGWPREGGYRRGSLHPPAHPVPRAGGPAAAEQPSVCRPPGGTVQGCHRPQLHHPAAPGSQERAQGDHQVTPCQPQALPYPGKARQGFSPTSSQTHPPPVGFGPLSPELQQFTWLSSSQSR